MFKREILLIKKARLGEIELPIDCLQDEIDADINTLWRCGKNYRCGICFFEKVLDVILFWVKIEIQNLKIVKCPLMRRTNVPMISS